MKISAVLIALLGGTTLYTTALLSNRLDVQRADQPFMKVTDAPVLDCPLSPHFRRGHDAASQGVPVDSSVLADASPVPIDSIAQTLSWNYGVALDNSARLQALQDWIRSQGSTQRP